MAAPARSRSAPPRAAQRPGNAFVEPCKSYARRQPEKTAAASSDLEVPAPRNPGPGASSTPDATSADGAMISTVALTPEERARLKVLVDARVRERLSVHTRRCS